MIPAGILASAPARLSPVAAYRFDVVTNERVADITGHGHTLALAAEGDIVAGHTVNPGALRTSPSGGRGAYCVDATSMNSSNFSTGVTLMAWVRPWEGAGEVGRDDFIMGFMTSTGGDSMYCLWRERGWSGLAGRLNANIRIGSLQAIAAPDGTPIETGGLPLGEWHHVATTFDGSNAVVYRDGVVLASLAVSGVTPVGELFIGGYGYGNCASDLSDVRVFDRALTATQIATYMSEPV